MFAERIALVLALLGLPCAALAQPSCPSEPPIVAQLQRDVGGDEFAQSHDALESPYPDDYSVIEPSHWRTVRLSIDLSHGGRCDIALLRPLPWVELTKAKVGEPIQLDMPEMGVAGAATVIAIEPCPEIKDAGEPGARPVIGKFVTTNARVVELLIEGLHEPIAATASHPFWSLDRNGWTAAGDLQPGEKLRALDGSASVMSVTPRPGVETVYNLEVHEDHTFFVSEVKLLVHNVCTFPGIKHWPGYDPSFRKIREVPDKVNPENIDFLRSIKPGKWKKIYQYGEDGRELHFFRHSSGEVFDPKWK